MPRTAGLIVSISLVSSSPAVAGRWGEPPLDDIVHRQPAEVRQGEAQAPAGERLTADTPRTTTDGNPFIASAGWSVVVRGAATIVEAAEARGRAEADAGVATGAKKSEMASRTNPDGVNSFLSISPGVMGFEFVVGTGLTRSLIILDAQHEGRFEAR